MNAHSVAHFAAPQTSDSICIICGLPAQKIYLVRNGVVENLIYSRFWAKQKGKEPTPGRR